MTGTACFEQKNYYL